MIDGENTVKAYYARDAKSFENFATVVFAEDRSKAKLAALSSDAFEDSEYIDIRIRRMPELDFLYKGKSEIDWYDQETRIIMVRDHGWSCLEYSWECDNCAARKYCRIDDEF